MADDLMELLEEGDVLDMMDSDDESIERYYDPDDELPEALRAKMAAKERAEEKTESLDDELAATVKASLVESVAAAKNANFDEDELAAAVKASIAASEAEAEKDFDQNELEAAMRESMKLMEANRVAYSSAPSRLSPVTAIPPSGQDRPSSLTGGYGLPPGLPPVFLPPGLTPPPGLPSPPGLLPPGLLPPGLGAPPGLPLPPCRISRDSGIAGDRSPIDGNEEAEKYGSEHGSNTQSESSADVNVEEDVNADDEASTETCTVVDGTKDLDYATPFDDPSVIEYDTVDGSKDYLSATPFDDHSVRVWEQLEVEGEGVYSRGQMMIIKEEVGEATLNFENCTDIHEHYLHILYPDFEIPGNKLKPAKGAAQRKWKDKRTWEQRSFYENNQTTGVNLLKTLQSSFSDVKQKNYEKRLKKEEWSKAEIAQSCGDDGREQHYTSIQFASERAEKEKEAGQWNEDGTREGSEHASQSGEGSQNTPSNSRRGSGERSGYSNEEISEGKRDSQDSRASQREHCEEREARDAQANFDDDQGPCAFGNHHLVVEAAVESSSDYNNDAEPPRSAFASVAGDEEQRDRSSTFESRGTEGTGAYGSADDRSFDARSPPEGDYMSRDRASTQSSSRNDFDGMKDHDIRDNQWEHRKDERQKEDRGKEEPVLDRHNESENGQGWGHESEQRDQSRHEDSWNSNGKRDRNDEERQRHESYPSQHARFERGERSDSRDNWEARESNGSRDRHDEERQRHESYASQNSRTERGIRDSRDDWGTQESNGKRDQYADVHERHDSYASQHARSDWNDRETRDETRQEEQKTKTKEVHYERFGESIGTGDRDSHNNWGNHQSRDKENSRDWKQSRNTDNSWEERRDRGTEEHHQNRSSRNAYDNRDDRERAYRGSQHSDDGRRNSRDQYGSNSSHDDRYNDDYNSQPARASQRTQYREEIDNRHNSRDSDPAPDLFGNRLKVYPDVEQYESRNSHNSPHSRNGDDRDHQHQFPFDSIPMDADRLARFGKDVSDSRIRHDSSRMSQASRASGRANSGHRDEHQHRDMDNSRQFRGSRDRVDDRESRGSYTGSNVDHRDRASNNNSREWHDDHRSRDAYDRREQDRRSESSRYSDRGQRDSRDTRDEYNTRNADHRSQGTRSYAGSNIDHRDHRDSSDWHEARESTRQSQHSRASDRAERDQHHVSRDHRSDYSQKHDVQSKASRSYAGSNYGQRNEKHRSDHHASREEAINDRAHEHPRQPSRTTSARPESDMVRRESRASGDSRNSHRGDPLEQYNERKARDEKEERERAEREWKLRTVYEDQMLRARMRTKNDEPLCGYLAKEYGVEKPALRFSARQPSESTTWVGGRTEFMAHVYYPDRDTAEAVDDEVIQRWYKDGLVHPCTLFSMKFGDWKAFHTQEAWLGEKEWVETPFHGQLDVRRRENEIDMDEFRFGEWTDEVLHIMQQHDKKMKTKQ